VSDLELPEHVARNRAYWDAQADAYAEWPDEPSVEVHLGYGDWIRLLRANGFEVIDLIEVQPPEGATTGFELTTPDWARRWPCEEIWKARKVAT
jgi:hypothetical protein